MSRRFHSQAEQHQRKPPETVRPFRSFFGREAEENREIRKRSLSKFAFVALHQAREIGTRRAGACECACRNARETEFGDRFGDSAGESRCLGDGRKIMQLIRLPGGVNDSIRQRLAAQPADGRQFRLRQRSGREIRP